MRSLLVQLGLILLCAPGVAQLRAGVGVTDITPPVGTPSAGYGDRAGAGMEGVHDPLLATALVIDNGTTRLVLLGVDHLGFDFSMVQQVAAAVRERDPAAELFLGSSHTHAGGGAYLDIPGLGTLLAGRFDAEMRQLYVDGATAAVLEALESLTPARVGLGYTRAEGLNRYRGDWPPNVETADQLTVIKVTDAEGRPRAVWFDYPAHPTVLPGADNMQFSADFVGYARQRLEEALVGARAIYFNGAQADVSPAPPSGDDMYERCASLGHALAQKVLELWPSIETSDSLAIEVLRHAFDVVVQPTSAGTRLPFERRPSEIGLVTLDGRHALVAIPGELSTVYDAELERFGRWLGYEHVTILGLTNDAQGYIVMPESWRHRTYESTVSFGGELYGEQIKSTAFALLHALEPEGSYHEDQVHPSELLGATGDP